MVWKKQEKHHNFQRDNYKEIWKEILYTYQKTTIYIVAFLYCLLVHFMYKIVNKTMFNIRDNLMVYIKNNIKSINITILFHSKNYVVKW
jgi:hypothetical protein